MPKAQLNPNQLPLFLPDSSWRPKQPSEWPDFRAHAKICGVDTETHDPNLKVRGQGFLREDARTVGVSLASEDGQRLYLPLYHEGGDNVDDPTQAINYLCHQLGGEQPKAGANLTYDLLALRQLGISLNGPLADIQVAGPLLDENRAEGYSLDNLAYSYLGQRKDETLLREAAAAFGLDPKKDLHRLPARFVGQYGELDAYLPIKIFEAQLKEMEKEDLLEIFELERKLQRTLFKMQCRGIRIDFDYIERCNKEQLKVEQTLLNQIYGALPQGMRISPSSSEDIAKALIGLGISDYEIPRTRPTKAHPTGVYSITNELLATIPGPFAEATLAWRKTNKMRKDFIERIVDDSHKGRIYTNWHQLRSFDEESKKDPFGTRSGRIASSNLNMTQIPARDPVWGPMIRGAFIPDEGCDWGIMDVSQQEPRLLLHYAYIFKRNGQHLPGSEEVRQRYIDDPSTHYHKMTHALVLEKTGKDIGYRNAKDINLGSAYGMGKYKMAAKLGVDLDTAIDLLGAVHEALPYTKILEKECMDRANKRGYIITLLGRRRRFNLWEPGDRKGHFTPKSSREAAVAEWGENVRRAYVHKALNALIQGGAADMMKQSLIMMDEENLLPQIQVYDEVDGSYEDHSQIMRVKHIMEHAVETTVPFLVKVGAGASWGDYEELA